MTDDQPPVDPVHRRRADRRPPRRVARPTRRLRRRGPLRLLRHLPSRPQRHDGGPPARGHRVHRPSGCGKSTVLRCFNRMNDLIEIARVEGKLTYHGVDLYDPAVNPVEVRRRIGMVFQKPNPFPKSIYDNVAYGPRLAGQKGNMDDIVERSLRGAALVGRGQGPPQGVGHGALGRPAAAALHRPGHRLRSRGDPHGRAVLGARPHRHRPHRAGHRARAARVRGRRVRGLRREALPGAHRRRARPLHRRQRGGGAGRPGPRRGAREPPGDGAGDPGAGRWAGRLRTR